jgi:hypothetical protein
MSRGIEQALEDLVMISGATGKIRITNLPNGNYCTVMFSEDYLNWDSLMKTTTKTVLPPAVLDCLNHEKRSA